MLSFLDINLAIGKLRQEIKIGLIFNEDLGDVVAVIGI